MSVLHVEQELFPQVVCQKFVKLVLQEHFLSQLLQLVLVVHQGIFLLIEQMYAPHVHLEHLQIKKEVLNVLIVLQVPMLLNQPQLNAQHALQGHFHLLCLLFVVHALKGLLQLQELLNVQAVQLELIHLLEPLLVLNALLELFQKLVKPYVMVVLKELMQVHKEL